MFEALFQALFFLPPGGVRNRGTALYCCRPVPWLPRRLAIGLMVAAVITYRTVREAAPCATASCSPQSGWRCWRSSWRACSVPRSSSGPRCRSRMSSPCCWTIRAACRLPTGDGQAARRYCSEQFGAPIARPLKALSDRFLVRTFRFPPPPARVASSAELHFDGSQTELGPALTAARATNSPGLPLAGLVMVTDGADTSDAALSEALLGLKAEKLPVFTVGVGRDTLDKDIQVDRVTRRAVGAQGHGAAGRRGHHAVRLRRKDGALDVEDDGRIVSIAGRAAAL